MKKLIIALALFTPTMLLAEGPDHDQLARTKGSFYISLSQNSLESAAITAEWNNQLDHVDGNISEVKFLSMTENLLEKQSILLSEFMQSNMEHVETGDDVLVFVKKVDGKVDQIHFLIPADEPGDTKLTLLSVYGNLKMKA